MFEDIFSKIKSLFTSTPRYDDTPTKESVSPNWREAGKLAAAAHKGKPDDQRASQRAYNALRASHLKACKTAKVRPDELYRSFEKFKAGWASHFEGIQAPPPPKS